MSAEEAEHHADEEIVDYETEEAAPPADTQAQEAPAAENEAQNQDAPAQAAADAQADAEKEAQAKEEAIRATMAADPDKTDGAGGDGSDPMAEPPHGSEVFVGGIPKTANVTDEQLREFASAGGEVFSCAVLKDPGSGANRGYGFIKYKSKEVAQAAMAKLNNQEMKDHPGHQIRVLPSQSKNRLYLGNLPKTMTREQLEAQLKDATKGLQSVELLMSKENPGQNRGFCFLEFYNHACAQHAKAALSPPHFELGSKPLTITFAEPRRADMAAEQQAEIKSIFVGNLPDTATEAKLREIFAPLGEITRSFIPAPRDGRQRREFGFVHFVDRASVLQAIENHEKGEHFVMDGAQLDIKMGRVYHEHPPAKFQGGRQGGYGQGVQGGFGGRGAGRFGGQMGMSGRFPQGGRMGGRGFGAGDYGGYGAMQGTGYDAGYAMDEGYGGDDWGYDGGDYGGGYGSYGMGGGMGSMGAMGGMGAAAGGGGMSMVPMMLPNGQVGYVLSGAAAGGGGAGMGMSMGMGTGMGMGGPMRGGRGMGGNIGGGGGGMGGGYGGAMGGRRGAYGGRGSGGYGGNQRYAPY